MATEPPPFEPSGEAGGLPPIEQMIQQALSGEGRYTQNFIEDVQAFTHAISWDKDLWIFGIFGAEALMLIVICLCRRSWETLSVLFAGNMLILFAGEYLNTFAAKHWESFSSQMYFDPHGAFVSVIVGLPLIILQLLIVILILKEACSMVVKVKRLELRHNARAKKKDE
eukprot:TRINITY_DN72410_c0_g1_i1.p1 TRINITY_DN72410_c0_g1~~TRINITY_DN72410_c0_g1_i1.p1  ORF type:complete len:196 (-),score=24.39 TRINITY_DN72410_c0_g1_i1:51-557(-)